MKRLVCFFDGTWNKPEDADRTNVVKLQRAVPAADAGGIAQVVHYEVGIATESALGEWTFAVGAVGFGVGSRIQGGYRFLTTGDPGLFRTLGERFLQLPLGEVEHVALAELEAAAA